MCTVLLKIGKSRLRTPVLSERFSKRRQLFYKGFSTIMCTVLLKIGKSRLRTPVLSERFSKRRQLFYKGFATNRRIQKSKNLKI